MMYRMVVLMFLACVWLKVWWTAATSGGGGKGVVRLASPWRDSASASASAQEQYDVFVDGWEAT